MFPLTPAGDRDRRNTERIHRVIIHCHLGSTPLCASSDAQVIVVIAVAVALLVAMAIALVVVLRRNKQRTAVAGVTPVEFKNNSPGRPNTAFTSYASLYGLPPGTPGNGGGYMDVAVFDPSGDSYLGSPYSPADMANGDGVHVALDGGSGDLVESTRV